jgi:hypothetical protein
MCARRPREAALALDQLRDLNSSGVAAAFVSVVGASLARYSCTIIGSALFHVLAVSSSVGAVADGTERALMGGLGPLVYAQGGTVGASQPINKAPTAPPPPPPPPPPAPKSVAPRFDELPKPTMPSYRFSDHFLRTYRGKTIGEFWDSYVVSLKLAGYDPLDMRFFSRPDGVIIVLPFELESDGYPAPQDRRFSYGTHFLPSFIDGAWQWFGHKTMGRWIVLILAPTGKTGPYPPESYASLRNFHATGKNFLPDDLRSLTINLADSFCAHVYEFEIPKRDDPIFQHSGPIDALLHLRRTKIRTE